jgi:DnaJ-class molecular chaperone
MNLEFDPNIDHYKALGVAAGAGADEIKKAYRKLAKANHPDSTGGDKAKEARFKEISAAYEVLGDARKRAQYDEIREQLRSGHIRASGPRPGGRGAAGPQVWDLSDLFGQFFAGGAAGGPGSGFRVEQVQVDPDDDGWAPFGGSPNRGTTQSRRRRQRRQPEGPPPPQTTRLQAPDGSWLTVQGADIHSDLRLGFAEAILGTVRDVATLTGATSVKILARPAARSCASRAKASALPMAVPVTTTSPSRSTCPASPR